MRAKSAAKREAILGVAAEVFREMGFERASMADICRRVGGSKATIYNHFPSKEELFAEVVERAVGGEFAAAHEALQASTDDLRSALLVFGRRFLTLLYSPDVVAVRRLVIAQGGRSCLLGRRTYEMGITRDLAMLEGFLADAGGRGELRVPDPRVAALHLRSLLEAELIDRFAFQMLDTLGDGEIAAVTERAVDTFLRAYTSGRDAVAVSICR